MRVLLSYPNTTDATYWSFKKARNMAADTASQFVNTDERLPPGESATETPGLTALDVERAGSMTDEGGASAALVESADVERKAP